MINFINNPKKCFINKCNIQQSLAIEEYNNYIKKIKNLNEQFANKEINEIDYKNSFLKLSKIKKRFTKKQIR